MPVLLNNSDLTHSKILLDNIYYNMKKFSNSVWYKNREQFRGI